MLALFWLSSYDASHNLDLAPQYGAKYQFYYTIQYISLDSNCEALRIS
jgi:hypothetical protein